MHLLPGFAPHLCNVPVKSVRASAGVTMEGVAPRAPSNREKGCSIGDCALAFIRNRLHVKNEAVVWLLWKSVMSDALMSGPTWTIPGKSPWFLTGSLSEVLLEKLPPQPSLNPSC